MIDSIVNGAFGALWGIITHVPLMIWAVLASGIILFGILMRYLTDLKIDLFLVAAFVIVNSLLVWRAHWIDQGYAKAKAEVVAAQLKMQGYKNTEGLIQTCYAQNTSATYLWDRNKGACVRADGAR